MSEQNLMAIHPVVVTIVVVVVVLVSLCGQSVTIFDTIWQVAHVYELYSCVWLKIFVDFSF